MSDWICYFVHEVGLVHEDSGNSVSFMTRQDRIAGDSREH
jgi:hypothetical protein